MRTLTLTVENLAFGMRVERADGVVTGWTDHDKAKTVTIDGDDLVLQPTNSITISSIVREIGLAVANLEATVIDFDETLTRADLLDGVWDGAEFYIFQYNWEAPSGGLIDWLSGRFGAVTPKLGRYVVELRSLTQALQNDVTRIVQADCDYRFGSTECGVSLGPHTYSGTVTGVTSQRVFTASGLTNPADDFTEGELTWTSGLNDGRRRKVMTHASGGVFTLADPAVRTIQVGDTFSVIRGCRKRRADCISFSNVLNFPGFDQKPTRSDIVEGDVA